MKASTAIQRREFEARNETIVFVGDQTESSCKMFTCQRGVYLPTRSSLANESDHLICQLRKLFFLKP